ncbi:hypothetical protein U3516DRAFT_579750, partial [Neocallimastix sp. 'constans']
MFIQSNRGSYVNSQINVNIRKNDSNTDRSKNTNNNRNKKPSIKHDNNVNNNINSNNKNITHNIANNNTNTDTNNYFKDAMDIDSDEYKENNDSKVKQNNIREKLKKSNYSFAKKVILELQNEPPIILNESEEEDSVINNILDPKRIQNVVENDIINSNQHTLKNDDENKTNGKNSSNNNLKNKSSMNKKMNENNNNKKTRQIKNTIKKTMINKPPLNYRSNI